jgi:hypothetical protein
VTWRGFTLIAAVQISGLAPDDWDKFDCVGMVSSLSVALPVTDLRQCTAYALQENFPWSAMEICQE